MVGVYSRRHSRLPFGGRRTTVRYRTVLVHAVCTIQRAASLERTDDVGPLFVLGVCLSSIQSQDTRIQTPVEQPELSVARTP